MPDAVSTTTSQRGAAAEERKGREAVEARHRQVEEHDVGLQLLRHHERLLAVRGRAARRRSRAHRAAMRARPASAGGRRRSARVRIPGLSAADGSADKREVKDGNDFQAWLLERDPARRPAGRHSRALPHESGPPDALRPAAATARAPDDDGARRRCSSPCWPRRASRPRAAASTSCSRVDSSSAPSPRPHSRSARSSAERRCARRKAGRRSSAACSATRSSRCAVHARTHRAGATGRSRTPSPPPASSSSSRGRSCATRARRCRR